jgi:hypothetical protein
VFIVVRQSRPGFGELFEGRGRKPEGRLLCSNYLSSYHDSNLALKEYLVKASDSGLYSHEPGDAEEESILAELTAKMQVR